MEMEKFAQGQVIQHKIADLMEERAIIYNCDEILVTRHSRLMIWGEGEVEYSKKSAPSVFNYVREILVNFKF